MSTSENKKRSNQFEEKRDQLIGQISLNLEQIITNMNTLNRNFESITSIGREFESVAQLWKTFQDVLSRDIPQEDKQESLQD
ncbi:DASH complex subunit DAD1 [Neolecta irregularis DAH-3]|uniref:DASH complex subunit DAD1 n=1 Tax=Neolecta irregularis (strain DAH-3) TaxID=1198029 RepID=A0A1U7LWY7_NEOID|nr:DASH complex subunit DAD1 [Neolecta irregularis DAH-3]|eukprot:OLL27083.1 DASH complex subunit DAD1 [Neolecta irregularis DAH-3]